MSWRRDWWRFWLSWTRGPSYARRSVHVQVGLGQRNVTVGYRRKGCIE